MVFQHAKTVAELSERLLELVEIFVQQSVKVFNPVCRVGNGIRVAVPPMDGVSEKFLHTCGPVLTFVKFIEIVQIAQKMGDAYLMSLDVNGEVRAMTVSRENSVFQVRFLQNGHPFLWLPGLWQSLSA